MQEIYANSADRRVYLDVPLVPDEETLLASVLENGEEVYSVSTISKDGDRYYFTLPFFFAQDEKEYDVKWQFIYTENDEGYEYDRLSKVKITTPILPLPEITTIIRGTDFTAAEIERAVRFAIQAYTGQSFGLHSETKEVRSTGGNSLQLPERLITLDSVQVSGWPYKLYDVYEPVGESFLGEGLFTIEGDGWWLRNVGYTDNGIKSDVSFHVNGPIFNPFNTSTGIYGSGRRLLVSGQWGWHAVPPAVQEAARLLANDYACNESMYRDRYLEAMTTSDWRLQFNSGAYMGTGNVRADQLLGEFVLKRGWAVI